MISGNQTALLAKALLKAGATWTPVYRAPTDANGMPMGDPVQVGCILGIQYRKGSLAATLQIDLPGTIIRTDVDRFEGLVANRCLFVQAGDILRIAGQDRKVSDVQEPAPCLYVLTFE